MNRYDFNCKCCGKQIGNAYYVDSIWYQCKQDDEYYQRISEILPRFKFDINGNIIDGEVTPGFDLDTFKNILKFIESENEFDIKRKVIHCFPKGFDTDKIIISLNGGEVIWYSRNTYYDTTEYADKVGIKQHDQSGRRSGFCICEECAKELNYICPLCGEELIKKDAMKDHPGGNGWGIKSGVNSRKPSPMCW